MSDDSRADFEKLKNFKHERRGSFTIYRLENGKIYRINTNIFRSLIIIFIILAGVAWAADGFRNPFVKSISFECKPGPLPCENPLYKNEEYRGLVPDYLIDDSPGIPAGMSFNPRHFLIKYYGSIVIFLIFAALVLNHLLYNKGVLKND